MKVDGVDILCDIAENRSDLAIVSSAFYNCGWKTEAQSLNLFVMFAVDLQKWHFLHRQRRAKNHRCDTIYDSDRRFEFCRVRDSRLRVSECRMYMK